MNLSVPLAHAKWFVAPHSHFPVEWSNLLSPIVLIGLAVGLAAVAGATLAARRTRVPALPGAAQLRVLAPDASVLLRVSLGLGLLGLAVIGRVWVPSMRAGDVDAGWAFLLVEASLGAWLISGVRLVAAALGVLGLACAVATVG